MLCILEPRDPTRAHRLACISNWLYSRFPNDGQVVSDAEVSEDETPLAVRISIQS